MRTFHFIGVLSLFLCAGYAFPVSAATLSLTSSSETFSLNEDVVVALVLDTDDSLINAVQGTVTFDTEKLTFVETRDGDSALTFWVEKPTLVEGGIHFSGMTPGGFSGKALPVLSLVFKARASGDAHLAVKDGGVFLNDGLGTAAPLVIQGADVSISSESTTKPTSFIEEDDEVPENFTPHIAQDPDVFNGESFLVFEAEDKKSGIAYYAVREGFFSWYHKGESPYKLTHQSLDRKVYIKAVDKKGNERVVMLLPQHTDRDGVIFRMLIPVLCFFISILLWKYVFRVRTKH